MISVRPPGQVIVCSRNSNVVIFSDTVNMRNVKLCMKVVLIELYPFHTLSVTLIVFQGHSNVKQCLLKILCSYPIKFKLCMIITLLGVYIVILSWMILTLFQGHRCVRNIICKLHVFYSCPL